MTCRTCTRRVCESLPEDLAHLVQEARAHLPEAELVPPNLRRRGREAGCEDLGAAVREDERACRLWWRLAGRRTA